MKKTTHKRESVKSAITELRKFTENNLKNNEEKNQKELLFSEELKDEKTLFMQINSKKFFSKKFNCKPVKIELTNPIYNNDNIRSVLFLRDVDNVENEMIRICNYKIPTLTKVIKMSELKSVYKTFESKRSLYSNYDFFFVDDAILNMMPSTLGNSFYKTQKKIPIPIRVSLDSDKSVLLESLKDRIISAFKYTYYLPPTGTLVSIKIGYFDNIFNDLKLLENIENVFDILDDSAIRNVYLKTKSSPALLIYESSEMFDN